MRTIPRIYPGPVPAGERRQECAYCGVKWYRKQGQMRKDAAGFWACMDCKDGRDTVTLNRLNSMNAAMPDRKPTEEP